MRTYSLCAREHLPRRHLASSSSGLVVIWAVTGAHYFWPIFPIAGWGIGLVMNVWDVYRSDEPNEEQIREEIERLKRSEPS